MVSKFNKAWAWWDDLPIFGRWVVAGFTIVPSLLVMGLLVSLFAKPVPEPEKTPAEALAQQRAEIDSELVMCVLGDDAPGLRDSLLLLITKDAEEESGKEVHDALRASYAALFLQYSQDPILYENCVHDVARYDPEYRDSLMEKYNGGRNTR